MRGDKKKNLKPRKTYTFVSSSLIRKGKKEKKGKILVFDVNKLFVRMKEEKVTPKWCGRGAKTFFFFLLPLTPTHHIV